MYRVPLPEFLRYDGGGFVARLMASEKKSLVDCLAWFTTARQLTMNAKFAKNAKNPSEIDTLH